MSAATNPAGAYRFRDHARYLDAWFEPADMAEIVRGYGRWLADARLPKLFVNADPGVILVGAQCEFCRTWRNQQEVTVPGRHFVQEDSPAEIGQAVADFLAKVP